MKSFLNVLRIGAISALCLGATACGGGGSEDDDTLARVVDLLTQDAGVNVGEQDDLDVIFTFANETVVDEDHNVTVVVKLPNGVTFVPESSRIDEITDDNRVDPAVEVCANGDTFLRFDLGQGELEDADNPDDDGDGRLKMVIAGSARVGAVTISASAGYDFEFVQGSCAADIIPQRRAAFFVN